MKHTWIYGLAGTLVLASTLAFGQGNSNGPGQGDGSCVGNCPNTGGGSPAVPITVNTEGATNDNTSTSSAVAGSVSGASIESSTNLGVAVGVSGGNSRNSVGVETGGATSSSQASGGHASGGHSYATGGDGGSVGDTQATVGNVAATVGDSVATVGNTTNEGNTSDVTVEGHTDNSQISYVNERSAASAASVFAGYCQTGASAQGLNGGFSVVNPEQFCNHIRMAAVALEAAERSQDDDKRDLYMTMYHQNLEEADGLLNATQDVSAVDAFFGYLARPLAVIGALIWLI